MKLAITGALVALATLTSAGTASAQSYDPDTIVMVNQAMSLTYEQTTKMFAAFPSEVRQAGGCMAYIEKGGSIRADGTTTDGTVLPLGLDPILSACNAGIAGR